jgi:hypothetical protein
VSLKRHWRRWSILALLLLAGVVLGVRWYLSSYMVKARVTAQLEALYGGRIQVGGVSLGLEHSILTGVELYEQGQGPGDQPWLQVERLEADVPLADLIKGRQPTTVRAAGVTITLRFDDKGRLATVLPPRPSTSGPPIETLPAVTLTDSHLVLLGTRGRRMQVDAIAATLRASGGRHELEATGSSTFSNWKADGWIDLTKKAVAVTMRSDRDIAVTQTLLNGLPFVVASTWNEVQINGTTPVLASFQYDWGNQRQSFRVHLEPKGTALHVAAIDLTTTDTAGQVDMGDGVITLSGLHGAGYGGTLAADGIIDFRGSSPRFNLTRIDLKNLDVRHLPPCWSLPPQLQGRVDATMALDILTAPGKRQIHGTGSGAIREARIAGQPSAGPIALTLRPAGLSTELAVEGHLPPSPITSLAEALQCKLPPATSGQLALDVQALLPLDTINDRRTFRIHAKATLDRAHLAGLSVSRMSADLDLADDTLSTINLTAALEPRGSVTGHANLRITEPYAFQLHLEPQGIDLAQLDQLDESLRPAIQVSGQVAASFDVEGTLSPWTAVSAGQATAKELIVQGWSVPGVKFRWHSDQDLLKVSDIAATAYGGQIIGTAEVPLRVGAKGDLNLTFQGIEVHGLAHDRFAVPVPVDGKVDGTLRGTLASDPSDLILALEVRAPRLLLDHVVTDKIAATLRYRQGFLAYRAAGQTLGGTFQLEGDVAMDEHRAPSRPQQGRLLLKHIDLGRVPEIWDPLAATSNIGGSMDAELDYRHDGADRFPIARGRAIITDLAWQSQTLASQIQGVVTLDRDRLVIRDLSTTLASGTMAGKVAVDLKHPERSWFKVDLENGDATELLRSWSTSAQELQGSLSVHLRGTMAREWTGAAEVVLTRGKVFGVEVTEWRLPLRYTFEPASATGTLNVTDSTATVAQGRVAGQFNAVWTDALRLDGKLTFNGVDLHQAFPAAKVGKGRATGHAEFSGDHVQSIDDVQGRLVASLQQTQALEFPVLKQLAPILGLTTTSTFQSGDIRLRLARGGAVQIERLSFPEGPLQLYAEGQVTLAGRVNLDVTANTGKLANLAAMIGIRLPETGMIGGDLLKRATAALSPNLVRIHVTGTVHQPNLQVVPLPMLTDQALRFFAGMRLN